MLIAKLNGEVKGNEKELYSDFPSDSSPCISSIHSSFIPLGNLESKVWDMNCIYYNWQYLLCSWKLGMGVHFDTNYNLFYW